MNARRFLAELKRRNVPRAAIGYSAGAWLLIQIATQVFPFFDISASAVRLIVLVLLAGFPFAIVWAWVFELTSHGIVRTEDMPPETARTRAAGRKIDFIIIAVLAVAVAMLLFDRFRPRDLDKSIAVLPFENMTSDPENAFFADGMQDDILTSLAKIRDLKVISRTSVMRYQDSRNRDLREIGATLGAAHILEGSVRRKGDRLRVTVQLIDARTDRHIWAESYDRVVSDALTLQGELAREIATALHATLSPEEKERVARKPTGNPDAYALYLRARQYELSPDTLLQDYKVAEQLYARAVALDPDFALAHARIATTSAAIFHFHEPLASWAAKAREEAAAALRLDGNSSDSHVAQALCLYWIEEQYDAALEAFARAARLAPNDSNIAALMAAIQRRQGKWQEAITSYERVQKLDPQNSNVVRNLVYTYSALRRWPEAQQAMQRWRGMAPESIVAQLQAGYLEFFQGRGTGPLRALLAQIPLATDPDGVVTGCRWDAAMIELDFAAAENALRESPLETIDYLNGGATPKAFLAGCTILARAGLPAARPLLEQAQTDFAAAAAAAPTIAESHANLGLVAAFLGRKEEALREGRRAVELKPLSEDAVDGAIMLCYLALIEARVGETDEAIANIARLLQTPGAVDSVFYSITVADLKTRWVWEELRSDPRFQQLLTTAPE